MPACRGSSGGPADSFVSGARRRNEKNTLMPVSPWKSNDPSPMQKMNANGLGQDGETVTEKKESGEAYAVEREQSADGEMQPRRQPGQKELLRRTGELSNLTSGGMEGITIPDSSTSNASSSADSPPGAFTRGIADSDEEAAEEERAEGRRSVGRRPPKEPNARSAPTGAGALTA